MLTDIQKRALDEAVIIWKHIAQSGDDKNTAVKKLFKLGSLPKQSYLYDCPLCDYLRDDEDEPLCSKCPWPDYPNKLNRQVKCINQASPFHNWAMANRKTAGKKVLRLLRKIRRQNKDPHSKCASQQAL